MNSAAIVKSVCTIAVTIGLFAGAQHFWPRDETSDGRDFSCMHEVGLKLLDYAAKTGKFPDRLSDIRPTGDSGEIRKLRSYIDEKYTAYSPPKNYPSDSQHILLARATKHGMAIIYGDGSGQRFSFRTGGQSEQAHGGDGGNAGL